MKHGLRFYFLLSCLSLVLLVPFAPSRTFAANTYSASLNGQACTVGPFTFDSLIGAYVASGSCPNLPSTGGYPIVPSTTDPNVDEVTVTACLSSNCGPTQETITIGCTPALTGSTCMTGNLPLGSQGTWQITIEYHGPSIPFEIDGLVSVSTFVAPQFPLGSILAVVAPLGALALFAASRKSQPRLLIP